MRVFVDTSALYAVLAEDDVHHAEAARSFAWLLRHGELVTHNYVHLEAEHLVRRRLGPVAASTLIDRLLPGLTTIWVDEGIHRAAIEGRRAGGRASLVDHVSFVVMRAAGLTTALAFDRDFEDQGFGAPDIPAATGHRLSESDADYATTAGPDLVGVAELANLSGRSINTIQTWRRRHRDFPDPLVTLASGPVWSWAPVERWIARRPARTTRSQPPGD